MPTAAEKKTLELGVMGYARPSSGIYVYEQTSAFRTVGGRVGLHGSVSNKMETQNGVFPGTNVASVCVRP